MHRRGYGERATRPLRWWEIAALRDADQLVFLDLYRSVLGAGAVYDRVLALEVSMHDGCEILEDWQIVYVRDVAEDERTWGEHGSLIAQWFLDGQGSHRWSRDADYQPVEPTPDLFGFFTRRTVQAGWCWP